MTIADVAQDDFACSFCSREPNEVVLIVADKTRGVRICNECLYIGMAFMAQSEELDFDALVASAKSEASSNV